MASVNVRIDDKLKDSSKNILENLGLDLTTAIKMFLTQVVIQEGLPFAVSLTKGLLDQALDDVEAGKIVSFSNISDLMEDLDAD